MARAEDALIANLDAITGFARAGLGDPDLAADVVQDSLLKALRLHRARKQLRERLEATCRVCSKHGCLDCSCDAADHPA